MRLSSAIVLGLTVSALTIIGLCIFTLRMQILANTWADDVIALTRSQMLLLEVAALWAQYWGLIAPAVILLAFIPAGTIALIKLSK